MSGATSNEINSYLREAQLAVENAQEVRAYHRKKTLRGDGQRESDLQMALERVKAAMRPLRSEIGRFPKQHPSATILSRQEKIRDASHALQRERRKLWKMLNDPKVNK